MRKLAPFAAVFVIVTAFYGTTYSYRHITDTDLNSHQTRALVLHGDINIGRYDFSRPKYAIHHGANQYSIYGVGVSLIGAPIYFFLAHFYLSDRIAQGVAAIPFVAGAIVAMLWLLLRLFGKKLAVAGTVVFAFGTTMWPLASMAFYTHGPVALLQILGVCALFSERERAPFWAGLAFAGAMFIRPTVFIFVVAVGIFYLLRGIGPAVKFGIGSFAPIAGILIQNRWIWGSWLKSGYSFAGVGFHGNVQRALFGLLFGWWRGLFVYSPILLLSVAGFILVVRKRRGYIEQRLLTLGIASIATILFYARWTTWWGGLSQFGYRYLLDVVPVLIVLSVYAMPSVTRVRSIAIPAGVVSIMTMAAGSVYSLGAWDVVNFPKHFGQTSIGQAWTVALDDPLPRIIRFAGVLIASAAIWWVTPPREDEDASRRFLKERRGAPMLME
ncbi:MAG: hypothetical protein ABR548_04605 [Actinomycetota bacterium]|nr:hypothetical protein [Actinomycetota bacterium]